MLSSSQHLDGKKGMLKLQDGDYNEWQASELFIWTCINQTNWLVHSWNIFYAQMNHKHT
jgi:hypothetical protein